MAVSFIRKGIVTGWGTAFDASPVGNLIHRAATWTETADDVNYPENTAGLLTSVDSLRTVTGTIDAMLPTPQIGNAGTLAFTTADEGYETNIQSWSLNINYSAVDVTTFSTDTSNRWRSFIPGNYEWTGTFTAIADDATKLYEAGEISATELVLTLASSNTFTGDVYITQLGAPFTVNGIAQVNYSFRGSGALTAAGSNNILSAGAVGLPTTDTLTFQYAEQTTTDGTLAVDAFWSSLALTVSPGEMTQVQIGWQGTGDVTNTAPSAA